MRLVPVRSDPATAPQSGFTLAETLVALFILALIASSGTTLLLGATGSGQQLARAEIDQKQLDLAQAFIRQDIAALSPRAVRSEDGYGPAGNLYGGEGVSGGDLLRFVRDGWLNPRDVLPRSDLQLVRYRLEAGNLIREAVIRPDATRSTPVSSRTLLTDVRQVSLRFWRGGQVSTYWLADDGQSQQILPDLIELDILFESGAELSIATLTGGRS